MPLLLDYDNFGANSRRYSSSRKQSAIINAILSFVLTLLQRFGMMNIAGRRALVDLPKMLGRRVVSPLGTPTKEYRH